MVKRREHKTPPYPRWQFALTGESVAFKGVNNFDELFQALEAEAQAVFSNALGVSEDPLVKSPGTVRSSEEVIAISIQTGLLGRLRKITQGIAFTDDLALLIINLFASVRNITSVIADESYAEGRREVANWITDLSHSRKVVLTSEVQKSLRQLMGRTSMLKFRVANYLKARFPEVQITPLKLHNLPESIKAKGRSFLRRELGKSIKAEQTIKEVFRKPPKRKRRAPIQPYPFEP